MVFPLLIVPLCSTVYEIESLGTCLNENIREYREPANVGPNIESCFEEAPLISRISFIALSAMVNCPLLIPPVGVSPATNTNRGLIASQRSLGAVLRKIINPGIRSRLRLYSVWNRR